MLKKVLTSLALIFGLIHISIASEPKQIDTKISCTSYEILNEVLEKYGEIPFVSMTAYRVVGSGRVVAHPAIMFVNPKTKSYTIVEKFSDALYCIVSTGEELSPYKE